MHKLKAIHCRVHSAYMGLTTNQSCLLVCTTERNQFVVMNPVIGSEENPVHITDANVGTLNVQAATEFTAAAQAVGAAQHAADAMQRQYIMGLETPATQH